MMADSLMFPFAVAFSLVGLGFKAAVDHIPATTTAAFFEVHSIEGKRVGNTAELTVDRSIHAPIPQSWVVRVMEETDQGLKEFCKARYPVFEYTPAAAPVGTVSLAWWTDGQCPVLPDGHAQIITTWTPALPGLSPTTKTVRIE